MGLIIDVLVIFFIVFALFSGPHIFKEYYEYIVAPHPWVKVDEEEFVKGRIFQNKTFFANKVYQETLI